MARVFTMNVCKRAQNLKVQPDDSIQMMAPEMNEYVNEFIFHQYINSLNGTQRDDGAGVYRISKRQALAIRDRVGELLDASDSVQEQKNQDSAAFGAYLPKNVSSMGYARKTAYVSAIHQAMGEMVDGYDAESQAKDEHLQKVYSDSLSRFQNMMGYPRYDYVRSATGEIQRYADGRAMTSRLPDAMKSAPRVLMLSPYAPGMRYRDAALNSGNRVMFVNLDEVKDKITDLSDGQRPVSLHDVLDTDIPVYHAAMKGMWGDDRTKYGFSVSDAMQIPWSDDRAMRMWTAGEALSQSDKSGASLMRMLMDEKTYAQVEHHINLGSNNGSGYADKASLQRSFDVVRRLQEMGIEGRFETDRRPGQLKYVIPTESGRTDAMNGSENIELRVIDPYAPSMMASRAYRAGVTYRFSTDKMVKNPDGSGWVVQDYDNPSVEDCVNLVRYARGEAVQMTDGAGLVGQPAAIPNHGNQAKSQPFVNGSYLSTNNNRTRVARFGPLLNARGKPTSYTVTIRAENDVERSRELFVSTPDAERYLRNAIDDAHHGFCDELGVDRLVEEYRAIQGQSGAADYMPKFSGNKVIASIQERYWSVLTGENKDLVKLNPAAINGASDAEDDDEMTEELTGAIFDEQPDSGVYEGTQEEKIRQHAADLEQVMIGQYEPDADGKRFNAANVANYMTGGGQYRNTSNLIGAMQTLGIKYDELKGRDFYNQSLGDRMLEFDEASAKPINDPSLDPWTRARGETILKALQHAGCLNREDMLPRSAPGSRGAMLPGDYVDVMRENKRLASEAKAKSSGEEIAAVEKALKTKRAAEKARMRGLSDKFWTDTGVTADAILIDKNGVVKYDVCRLERQGPSEMMIQPVSGYLGQLMPPDKQGVVQTKFAVSPNYEFLPTATATVVPDDFKNGKPSSMMERMRLTTYDRFIDSAIEASISKDIAGPVDLIGSTTNLNAAVRHMTARRFEVGELDKLPEDQAAAIKGTKMVRMSKSLFEGSNMDTIYEAERDSSYDELDDMRVNPMVLMQHRDVMQLAESDKGYLDIKYTGLALSQGKHRALAEGAQVMPDGRVIPVTGPDGKPVDSPSAITRYLEDEHYGQFDMGDRENMGASAIMQGKNHEIANVAMIPMGGWTFEDQVVMSKDFAERLGIQQLGDKVSDYHGNKGVTGLIIDPEMDMDEARKRGLENVVAWFRANDGLNGRPRLDVVQNMGSAFSRNNAGLYREVMSRGCEDLISPDGTVYPGGIGKLDIVRMEQTAEHKGSDLTVDEDDSHLGARTSRNDGAQAGWSHIANNRWDAMSSAGRKNGRAWEDAREYLNLLNIDFDETGDLHFGITEHTGEKRTTFEMQPLIRDNSGRVQSRKMLAAFNIAAEREGGFIEIPFPIKFPNAPGALGPDGKPVGDMYTPEIPDDERSPESKQAYPGKVYRLPLLAASLRTGQEYEDESARYHDYSNRYQRIMTSSYEYRKAVEDMQKGKGDEASLKQKMADCQSDAQAQYDGITTDVITHKIQGKRNMFRSTLLSTKRQATTLVSLHDPRLPAGISSMSTDAAKAVGFKEQEIARSMRTSFRPNQVDKMMERSKNAPFRVVTRDPVIVYTGESAERFALDDRGPEGGGKYVISSNTAVVGTQKQMDHDGDTEAVFACSREDLHLMGQETRMLNLAEYDEKTDQYALFYGKAQDLAIGWAVDPTKKESYDKLVQEINASEKVRRELDVKRADVDARADAGELTMVQHVVESAPLNEELAKSDTLRYQQLTALSQHMVSSFSDAYLDKLEGKLPPEKMPYMNFTDAKTVIQSLDNIQAIGYKGKPAQLDEFAKTLGVTYERGADSQIRYDTFHDTGASRRSYEELGLTRIARAFQQLHTGKAGNETILSVNAAGRDAIKGNLSGRYVSTQEAVRQCQLVSHLVTQRTLQVKHGPDDVAVMQRIERVLPLLDRGVKLSVNGGQWKEERDSSGNSVQATPEEFRDALLALYNNPKEAGGMGFNISRETASIVADVRTDPKNPNRVMDITSTGREARMSTLQQLAYKGGGKSEMQALHELTARGANMFKVPGQDEVAEWNRVYIPEAIARNMDAERKQARGEEAEFTPVSKSMKGPRKLYTQAADVYVRMKGGHLDQPEPETVSNALSDDLNNGPEMAPAESSAETTVVREAVTSGKTSDAKTGKQFVASEAIKDSDLGKDELEAAKRQKAAEQRKATNPNNKYD